MTDDEQARLLLGLTPLAERQVEEQLFGAQAVAVVGSAADAGELLALAERRQVDAVLLSAELSGLDPARCARLRTGGLRLLGLALDEQNAAALAALGVDAVLCSPLTPDELAAACRDRPAPAAPSDAVERQLARARPDGSARRRTGSVVAVLAAAGSPGASECAGSLAALAAQRWPTLLLELDLCGGSLDLRLGADPQRGSLLGLVRGDAAEGPLDRLLERWACGGERGWPPVLVAPPDLDAHIDELARPGVIRAALDAAASLYPLVICDVGSLLATPGELPKAARCHREALLSADAVLLVIGAREQQLRAGRAQLALLLEGLGIKRERLRLCVSGVGAPGAGGRRELEAILAGELAALRLAVDAWLPYDGRALTRARRRGLPLALARPHGRYARALHALLDELLLPSQPVPRERKARLPVPVPVPDSPTDEEVRLPWRS